MNLRELKLEKGKIVKVSKDTAFIGYQDGSLKVISISNFDFEPKIGDYVEVYDGVVIKIGSENISDIKKYFEPKKRKIGLNKIALIPGLIIGIFLLIMGIFILSNKPMQDDEPNTSISDSTSESTLEHEAGETDYFNDFLKQNIGKNLTYSGNIVVIDDKKIYIQSDNIYVENEKYEAKGIKSEPTGSFGDIEVNATYKVKDGETGGKSLGFDAKIVESHGKPLLEIYDVYTVGQTYQEYMQKGIESNSIFEVHGTVTKVEKIENNEVLGLLVTIEPRLIDVVHDGNRPFRFKDGQEIKLALNKQTEEDFIKERKPLSVGDDIKIFGTLMTDSLDILLANQGGSFLNVDN